MSVTPIQVSPCLPSPSQGGSPEGERALKRKRGGGFPQDSLGWFPWKQEDGGVCLGTGVKLEVPGYPWRWVGVGGTVVGGPGTSASLHPTLEGSMSLWGVPCLPSCWDS